MYLVAAPLQLVELDSTGCGILQAYVRTSLVGPCVLLLFGVRVRGFQGGRTRS